MNDENLIPMNQRTKSEQREIARKGGIASGKSRQKRKLLREELLFQLSIEGVQPLLCRSLIQQAINGTPRAFEAIRDTIGENPKVQREMELKGELKYDEQTDIGEESIQTPITPIRGRGYPKDDTDK